jgi:hypothetical protein
VNLVAYCHALLEEGSARCSFRLAMGPCAQHKTANRSKQHSKISPLYCLTLSHKTEQNSDA